MSKFDDKPFREHAKWLAFQRSSYEWPKYWRAVIFKLDKRYDVLTDKHTYVVLPRNPEYEAYTTKEELDLMHHIKAVDVDGIIKTLPPMHLGPAEFDSLEDIDQWAQVAWRIK